MSKLNLATYRKDTFIISPDPWGDYMIESENIRYSTIGSLHGLQCRNADNHSEIIQKCEAVHNLITEIEELNK